jgi:serine/threonine protein kinase
MFYCHKHCGTAPYMAPEILIQHNQYKPFIADIWALGVILFVLFNKAYPFNFED